MNESAPVQYRIGMVTAGMMVAGAVLADAIDILCNVTGLLIPLAPVISIVAEGSLAVWFFLCGVSYFSGKRSTTKLITIATVFVTKLVPVLNALPELTIGTILIIRATRAEDREKAMSIGGGASDQETNSANNTIRDAEYEEVA